jgi:hypothetical protein
LGSAAARTTTDAARALGLRRAARRPSRPRRAAGGAGFSQAQTAGGGPAARARGGHARVRTARPRRSGRRRPCRTRWRSARQPCSRAAARRAKKGRCVSEPRKNRRVWLQHRRAKPPPPPRRARTRTAATGAGARTADGARATIFGARRCVRGVREPNDEYRHQTQRQRATRGSGVRMPVLGLGGQPRPQNALFRAASPRAAARASLAAALRTRVACDTSCTLNLSRRKGVQHRGQQVTERTGRVDSACGRHARQRRWRRGLGCCAKHRIGAFSVPVHHGGTPGRRIMPQQHARHGDPARAPRDAPLFEARASLFLP